MGMAPLSMTTRVCSDVPDEMLVSVHAASKSSGALSSARAMGYASQVSGGRMSGVREREVVCEVALARTALAKLDEARHRAGGDDLHDRRIALDREQLAESRRGIQLLGRILRMQQLYVIGKVI